MHVYFINDCVQVTPTENYGYLAYKASYVEETRGNVNLLVEGNVITELHFINCLCMVASSTIVLRLKVKPL